MKFPLFALQAVSKKYSNKKNGFSLQNISFSIFAGETLGVIGESGSGKTTLGKLLIRLLLADCGSILFRDKDLALLSKSEITQYRRSVQMVFQNPSLTCNPKKRIRDILLEPLEIHKLLPVNQRHERIAELLHLVKLPADLTIKYPSECSGGQLQRVGIARALALNPEVVIFDEPLTALDLPTAMQIVDLLHFLQKKFNLTYIFISHDLSMIEKIANRILVLKGGRVIELGTTQEILSTPREEYTKNLISASFLL